MANGHKERRHKAALTNRLAQGITAFMTFNSLFHQFKKSTQEYFRIQTTAAYVKGVEIVYEIFLFQLGVLICVFFLLFGIVLVEGALIFMLPLLLLVGGLPMWPYSKSWGYYPSGGVGTLLLIIVILMLLGRI